MDGLAWLNAARPADAMAALFRCCGCAGWAAAVTAARPFATAEAMFEKASEEWKKASREDIIEAFSHHPRIGDRESLKTRFPLTHEWSSGEQSSVASAGEDVLDALEAGNRQYERAFGHIFIVCASGKTAAEMLELLRARLGNAPDVELRIAAEEQGKIMRLRLSKLLEEQPVTLTV